MLALALLALLSLDDRIQYSAVHLVTKNTECSGTVVSPGVVLTARHCIHESFDYAEVGGPDTRYTGFGKVTKSKSVDLALVRVPGADHAANIAAESPHRGDAFTMVGLSSDVPWALARGFVMSNYPADVMYKNDPHPYHMTVLACQGCDEGDSGSGVFNLLGELVGVFVASSENNVRTYMVPLADVKAFLAANKVY
jgi:V8-like Glu-specific endopeptidase